MWCKWHTPYIIVHVQVWYTAVDLWKKYKHRVSLYKHVLDEFEYQLQLEFHICIEPTINYEYPDEFWEIVQKFQSKTVR